MIQDSKSSFGEKLLRIFLGPEECESLSGDLEEIHRDMLENKGKLNASLWYLHQIIKTAWNTATLSLYWSMIMIKSYFIIALRNIKRQKVFTFINFFGLAIGLGVSLIITFYIRDDLRYDRFHKDGDRIYRILSVGVKKGTKNSITAGPLVRDFKHNIPEVIAATRITPGGRPAVGLPGTNFNDTENSSFVRIKCIFADADFFNVFDFKILRGEDGTALGKKGSIFLTIESAETIFGSEDPLGKSIAVGPMENAYVAGIVEAPPSTSHIQFGMIIPLIPEENPLWWDNHENLALRGLSLIHI